MAALPMLCAFVDLDALVASVKHHVAMHARAFEHLLEHTLVADIAIDPERLSALLLQYANDKDDGEPDARAQSTITCRKGSYYRPQMLNARAFTECGWDMKKKGAANHRTLENLLTRTLHDAGATPADADSHSRVLVLVTGAVTSSIVSVLEAFVAAHWRVQLFCLAHCEHASDVAQLCRTSVVHMDDWLSDVLVDCKQLRVCPPLSALSPRASATKASAAPSCAPAPAMSPTKAAAAMKEQGIAAKKTRALAATPSQYSAGERQRFVFMDFDNVTAGLYSSHRLYQRVAGARNARDLYLNLRALTARICGDDNSSRIALQLATYYNSSEAMALALRTHRWRVQKQETVSDTTLQLELFSHLVASPDQDKTLVLVTGDGNNAASNKSFKAIVERYLQQHWFVEIHTWVHALSESYIDFQRAHPEQLVVRPLDAVFHDLVSLKTNARAAASGAGASPPATAPASPSKSSSSKSSSGKSSSGSEPGAAEAVPVLALAHIEKLQDAFTALRVAAVARGDLPAHVLARRTSEEQERVEAADVAAHL